MWRYWYCSGGVWKRVDFENEMAVALLSYWASHDGVEHFSYQILPLPF